MKKPDGTGSRFLWVFPLCWAGFIFYMSSIPGEEIELPFWFPGLDKLAHAGIYAILSVLLFVPLRRERGLRLNRAARLAFVLSTLYGVSDELHQLFVPHRTCELGDVLANALGSMAVFVLVFWMRKTSRGDEAPASCEEASDGKRPGGSGTDLE